VEGAPVLVGGLDRFAVANPASETTRFYMQF